MPKYDKEGRLIVRPEPGDAINVDVVDAGGHFVGTEAETVLQELGSARGAAASVDARLDVVLEEDGTLKEHVVEVSAKARASLGHEMLDVTNDKWTKVDLDTETYDPGANFSVALLGSGTATGTVGNHLIDAGYDFAAAGIAVGMRIKNTDDLTYSYITVVAVGDLTLRDNIFIAGEDWEVKGGRFTAPVAGYYQFAAQVWWKHGTMVGDKRIYVSINVNGVIQMLGQVHSAFTGSLGTAVLDIYYLAVNDFVELWANAAVGVNTTDIDDGSEKTFMAIHFLSKA